MQPICKGAGAEVLELALPEDEEDAEEQQQADLAPNGHGKHAAAKAGPEDEVYMCCCKQGLSLWLCIVPGTS